MQYTFDFRMQIEPLTIIVFHTHYLAEQIEPFSTGLLLRKKLRIAYCLNEKSFYIADIR